MRKINYIKKLTAMKYTKFAMGIVIGVLIAAISIYYASTILFDSAEVGYDNTSSGLTSDNVQDAIDELNAICPFGASPTVQNFGYTGYDQIYIAPITGTYKLEVWGAQGGTSNTYRGGYGAYATGKISLDAGDVLFINVGGVGGSNCVTTDCQGGYNGGGNSGHFTGDNLNYTSGGGGATSIITIPGKLYNFSGSSSQSYIIIVAAGGGGGYYHTNGSNYSMTGGNGGGIQGQATANPSGFYSTSYPAGGGTQTSGGTAGYRGTAGSFGTGGNGSGGGSGGGGGFYGGGGAGHSSTGGGSSYIGNASLTDKYIICHSCTASTATNTKTTASSNVSGDPVSDYSKQGNGYAIIRYLY